MEKVRRLAGQSHAAEDSGAESLLSTEPFSLEMENWGCGPPRSFSGQVFLRQRETYRSLLCGEVPFL